jgi:hypothetical protein
LPSARTVIDAHLNTMSRVLLRAAFVASALSLVSTYGLAIFYDQRADTFYVHDVSGTVLLAAQPFVVLVYTAVMTHADISCSMQCIVAAVVLAFWALIGLFLVALFRQYNIVDLFIAMRNASTAEDRMLIIRVDEIAWWFPVSQFGIVVAIYAWYLVTATETLRRFRQRQRALATEDT